MRPMLIAVCGVDGVGKTTVAKEIARRIDFVYLKTPPEKYDPMRPLFDEESVPGFTRFAFYLGCVFDSAVRIREILATGRGVIADRYLLSLQIYHEVLTQRDLTGFIEMVGFPRADLNLVLTASASTAQERLKSRANPGSGERLERDTEFMRSVAMRFADLGPDQATQVDTEGRSVEEIVTECVCLVEARHGDPGELKTT